MPLPDGQGNSSFAPGSARRRALRTRTGWGVWRAPYGAASTRADTACRATARRLERSQRACYDGVGTGTVDARARSVGAAASSPPGCWPHLSRVLASSSCGRRPAGVVYGASGLGQPSAVPAQTRGDSFTLRPVDDNTPPRCRVLPPQFRRSLTPSAPLRICCRSGLTPSPRGACWTRCRCGFTRSR
jgi:hypothetical protein